MKVFNSIILSCLIMGSMSIISANSSYKIKLTEGVSYYLENSGQGSWVVKNEDNIDVGFIQRNVVSNTFEVKNIEGTIIGTTTILNPDALEIINNQQ